MDLHKRWRRSSLPCDTSTPTKPPISLGICVGLVGVRSDIEKEIEHERKILNVVREIRSEDPHIGGYKLWLMLPRAKPRHTTVQIGRGCLSLEKVDSQSQ